MSKIPRTKGKAGTKVIRAQPSTQHEASNPKSTTTAWPQSRPPTSSIHERGVFNSRDSSSHPIQPPTAYSTGSTKNPTPHSNHCSQHALGQGKLYSGSATLHSHPSHHSPLSIQQNRCRCHYHYHFHHADGSQTPKEQVRSVHARVHVYARQTLYSRTWREIVQTTRHHCYHRQSGRKGEKS